MRLSRACTACQHRAINSRSHSLLICEGVRGAEAPFKRFRAHSTHKGQETGDNYVSREETTPLLIREPHTRPLMGLSQRFRSCMGASVLSKSGGPCTGVAQPLRTCTRTRGDRPRQQMTQRRVIHGRMACVRARWMPVPAARLRKSISARGRGNAMDIHAYGPRSRASNHNYRPVPAAHMQVHARLPLCALGTRGIPNCRADGREEKSAHQLKE